MKQSKIQLQLSKIYYKQCFISTIYIMSFLSTIVHPSIHVMSIDLKLAPRISLITNFAPLIDIACLINGWQLAKMKKSIPDISLP